jgi:SPP1 family predicted phage head-tail adaptor
MRIIDYYVNQEGTRYYDLTRDEYGEETYASNESVKLRFHENKERRIEQTQAGEVQFWVSTIWVLPDQDMTAEDLIEYDSKTYKIQNIDIKRDFEGNILHKVIEVVEKS